MKLIILFNGKEYFVEPLPEGGHSTTVLENHPGCIVLDNAESEEEAAVKIRRDKECHKAEWI